MGRKNYLIEGVSCTGKTSVCDELQRRGYNAIHGDRDLSYQGDPTTGEPMAGRSHAHHIWRVEQVRLLTADPGHNMTFFCGGSRNWRSFVHLFDGVFVLEIDLETLQHRLATRPLDEWGATRPERNLVIRQHQTKQDLPNCGVSIDATQPLSGVVDEILRHTGK